MRIGRARAFKRIQLGRRYPARLANPDLGILRRLFAAPVARSRLLAIIIEEDLAGIQGADFCCAAPVGHTEAFILAIRPSTGV